MKKCPHCEEEIHELAKKCKFCKEFIETGTQKDWNKNITTIIPDSINEKYEEIKYDAEEFIKNIKVEIVLLNQAFQELERLLYMPIEKHLQDSSQRTQVINHLKASKQWIETGLNRIKTLYVGRTNIEQDIITLTNKSISKWQQEDLNNLLSEIQWLAKGITAIEWQANRLQEKIAQKLELIDLFRPYTEKLLEKIWWLFFFIVIICFILIVFN